MREHKFESEDEYGTPNTQSMIMSGLNFRAKDKDGKELPQKYVGECWAWLAQGKDISIELSTGYFDRNGDEIFVGDNLYVHYKDENLCIVKFGSYPVDQFTKDIREPHTGFYLEEVSTGDKIYIGLLNGNSLIIP